MGETRQRKAAWFFNAGMINFWLSYVCVYKKDKNNWIGMCYGNGKEYIDISNNKDNDRYYIPQVIPDGSGNTGSIGACSFITLLFSINKPGFKFQEFLWERRRRTICNKNTRKFQRTRDNEST